MPPIIKATLIRLSLFYVTMSEESSLSSDLRKLAPYDVSCVCEPLRRYGSHSLPMTAGPVSDALPISREMQPRRDARGIVLFDMMEWNVSHVASLWSRPLTRGSRARRTACLLLFLHYSSHLFSGGRWKRARVKDGGNLTKRWAFHCPATNSMHACFLGQVIHRRYRTRHKHASM